MAETCCELKALSVDLQIPVMGSWQLGKDAAKKRKKTIRKGKNK